VCLCAACQVSLFLTSSGVLITIFPGAAAGGGRVADKVREAGARGGGRQQGHKPHTAHVLHMHPLLMVRRECSECVYSCQHE
jgi:hypothetical protein